MYPAIVLFFIVFVHYCTRRSTFCVYGFIALSVFFCCQSFSFDCSDPFKDMIQDSMQIYC